MTKNSAKIEIKETNVKKETSTDKVGYKYPVSARPEPISIPEEDCIKLSEAGRLLGCGKECIRQKTVKGILGYTKFKDSVWVSKSQTLALKARYEKDRAARNIIADKPAKATAGKSVAKKHKPAGRRA